MKKLLFLSSLCILAACQTSQSQKENDQIDCHMCELAKTIVEELKCDYDCRITEAFLSSIHDYGECYTVFVKGEFQNQYGAYKKSIFGVKFDKNDEFCSITDEFKSNPRQVSPFLQTPEFQKIFYSNGDILFFKYCDCHNL